MNRLSAGRPVAATRFATGSDWLAWRTPSVSLVIGRAARDRELSVCVVDDHQTSRSNSKLLRQPWPDDDLQELAVDFADSLGKGRKHSSTCLEWSGAGGLTPRWSKRSSLLRLEMPLRERTAGAGLEVAFEADGSGGVFELHDDVEVPWTVPCSVWAAPNVVAGDSRGHVRREPNVEVRARRRGFQDVDEAFAADHVPTEGKHGASEVARQTLLVSWDISGVVAVLAKSLG